MKATARAGSNIAFIKFWGQKNEALRIPENNSISMTLGELWSQTTVSFEEDLHQDQIFFDGEEASPSFSKRVIQHLDLIRSLTQVNLQAIVETQNNFPMGAGIASSASGFAALTVATANALGLKWNQKRLSMIARRGSGSAARSILGGFVELLAGVDDDTSYATQIKPEDHWKLCDIVAIVEAEEKEVGSSEGHQLFKTTPVHSARLNKLHHLLAMTRSAIERKDFMSLAKASEQDAIMMHAVMMTSDPPLFYWEPGTIELIKAVRNWRINDNIPVFFTIDAGPNVHIITIEQFRKEIEARVLELSLTSQILTSSIGSSASLV